MGDGARRCRHRVRARRANDVATLVLRQRGTRTRAPTDPRCFTRLDADAAWRDVAARRASTSRRVEVAGSQRPTKSGLTWRPHLPTTSPPFSRCTDSRYRPTPSCSTRSSPIASIERASRSHGGRSAGGADRGRSVAQARHLRHASHRRYFSSSRQRHRTIGTWHNSTSPRRTCSPRRVICTACGIGRISTNTSHDRRTPTGSTRTRFFFESTRTATARPTRDGCDMTPWWDF